jgi:outer membrane protein OmpA-like peptidoglycan-associated protein
MKNLSRLLVVLPAVALIATGCATKKYVKGEVGAVHTRVDSVEGEVEQAQQRLSEHDKRISTAQDTANGASKTAQEALDRAVAAGKLAEGKLLFESVLTDDKVRFSFDKAELSDAGKTALDEFAERLKSENKNIYLEIQGHTDNVGGEDYNLDLGQQRAEAVRRYLNQKHGLPLHKMSVISYGESSPIADNGSREGRSTNRRVVLVVLQ